MEDKRLAGVGVNSFKSIISSDGFVLQEADRIKGFNKWPLRHW